MEDVDYDVESDGGAVIGGNADTGGGDLTGRDRVAGSWGNARATGHNTNRINIYGERNPQREPEDLPMTSRDFARIDELTSSVRELTKSNYELSGRIALLEAQFRNELNLQKERIELLRQQINAPAPKVAFSQDQMREIFRMIILAATVILVAMVLAANWGKWAT